MFFSFLRSRGGSVRRETYQDQDAISTQDKHLERTLQSLDNKGRCRGDNVDLGLTVLDGKLDRYPETLPGAGGLCDIFTDLLR